MADNNGGGGNTLLALIVGGLLVFVVLIFVFGGFPGLSRHDTITIQTPKVGVIQRSLHSPT
jgi:hypothetical protein